jgi:hypothetical protein
VVAEDQGGCSDDEEDGWFDDTESETSSDDGRLDEQQQDALEGHVLQFMLPLLDHVLGDNEYTSALISSMAVLGDQRGERLVKPVSIHAQAVRRSQHIAHVGFVLVNVVAARSDRPSSSGRLGFRRRSRYCTAALGVCAGYGRPIHDIDRV